MSFKHYSPLRYPGGKTSLYDFLKNTIQLNNLQDQDFYEPFAGGAGASLKLLFNEYVRNIYLNDLDIFIYKFWESVLYHNDELLKLINDTPVNMNEWKKRNSLFKSKELSQMSTAEIGFTAFFLNRTNRSGILRSGVIGGLEQLGKWKIDARFNKKELMQKIYKIGFYKDRIHISNLNSTMFINKIIKNDIFESIIYIDPPYVGQGKNLYNHSFDFQQHKKLSRLLIKNQKLKWVLSYDDNKLIHELYTNIDKQVLEFNYYVHKVKVDKELIISSISCKIPKTSTNQFSNSNDVTSKIVI